MRSTAAAAGVLAVALAACSGGGRDQRPQRVAARAPAPAARDSVRDSVRDSTRDTTRAVGDTVVEAGDVAVDSGALMPREKWISDANVLSLLSLMNARQINAANVELQSWHSDTVRAFAVSMLRDHADLQHSIDSVVDRTHIAPVAPALSQSVSLTMQAQVDSLVGRGPSLDRAYVHEAVGSHQLMSDYVQQLAAVAERPEVQAVVAGAVSRVSAQLARARMLDSLLTRVDSATKADSLARRAARDSSRAARQRREHGG